jgi:diguanylate cyclase (GGDEF)-like protein
MPDMDGFEVLRCLKNDPATLHIPVIVLSGLQSAQDKVMAFDLGAIRLHHQALQSHRAPRACTLRAPHAQAGADARTVRTARRAHGLWNRSYFDKRWSDEVSANLRHGRPLSLAMVDVDHFKQINDTYGHPAGDAVLQGMSKMLQRECRQEDVACRYGGEEFALIMPDTAPVAALKVCERIRIAMTEIAWPRHPERTITLSIGLTGASAKANLTPVNWLELADQNLYLAKRSGRNRVIMTEADPKLRLAVG